MSRNARFRPLPCALDAFSALNNQGICLTGFDCQLECRELWREIQSAEPTSCGTETVAHGGRGGRCQTRR